MLRSSVVASVALFLVAGFAAADEPKVKVGGTVKVVQGTFQKLDEGKVSLIASGSKEAKSYKIDKNAKSFVGGKAVPISDVMKDWKEGHAAVFYVNDQDEVVGVGEPRKK
jgi:hypothetical protein